MIAGQPVVYKTGFLLYKQLTALGNKSTVDLVLWLPNPFKKYQWNECCSLVCSESSVIAVLAAAAGAEGWFTARFYSA